MTKKAFFRTRTAREIQDLDNEQHATSNLIYRILDLEDNDFLIIDKTFTPDKFSTPSKYKKHAQELKLPRYSSARELIDKRIIPVRQRELAFNRLRDRFKKTGQASFLSGYTFRPPEGSIDETPRKVALVHCLEGVRIVRYANLVPGVAISIDSYDDARAVEREGGFFVLNVPSRTEKHDRHDVGLESVAIEDNELKYVIGQSINTDHTCLDKRYNWELRFKHSPKNIRQSAEKSRIIQFCPHDIAAYLTLADVYWNKDKNIVPLAMSQFAIPTQFVVDYYKKLLNNVLVQDIHREGENREKPFLRTLNQSEQEILLWGLVYREGHDKTFFATENIRNYDWSVRGRY